MGRLLALTVLMTFLVFLVGADQVNSQENQQQGQQAQTPKRADVYQVRDFSHLLGAEGLNDNLLQNHFKLYEGYVKHTNKYLQLFRQLDPSSTEFADVKRRFGFEFDGMRLHELYFENMAKDAKTPAENSPLLKAIAQEYGGFDQWKTRFLAVGAMRGIGWAILYVDPRTGQLVNDWVNEHHHNHMAACAPLLVMDVWEHAYLTQFGLDRKQYMDVFFNHIDWDVVAQRYQDVQRQWKEKEPQP